MADHSFADVDELVVLMLKAMRSAEKEYLMLCDQYPDLVKSRTDNAAAVEAGVRSAA